MRQVTGRRAIVIDAEHFRAFGQLPQLSVRQFNDLGADEAEVAQALASQLPHLGTDVRTRLEGDDGARPSELPGSRRERTIELTFLFAVAFSLVGIGCGWQ